MNARFGIGGLQASALLACTLLVAQPTSAMDDGATDAAALDVPEAFEVCLSCHAYQPDEPPLEGPSLWQVFGRRIASLEDYEYSEALSRREGRWDRETLDRLLTDPQAFAPGSRMTFGGVRSAADRRQVLDFLETLVPDSRVPAAAESGDDTERRN